MAITPRLETAIWFVHEGINQACILHWEVTPPPTTQAEVDTLGTTLSTAWHGAIKNTITTECLYNGLTVRFVAANSGFTTEALNNLGAGTITGDTCPGEVAAIIRKLGNGPPKRAHGTMFWPCVPESFTEDSRLTAAAVGVYNTLCNLVLTNATYGSFDLDPVVMSRKSGSLFIVGSYKVMSVLGHQRRRRPRR